jgi:hypothetical protein
VGALRRRHQRRASADAGSEVPDPEVSRVRVLREPVRGADEPLGKQADIEAQVCRPQVGRLFVRACEETIDLSVLAEVVEADITSAGLPRRLGVDFLEILQHGFHRGAEAVKIEAVEANPWSARRQRVVVRSQPLDELDHLGVAPHPGWEAAEVGERFNGGDVVAHTAHVAVDAVGVGPIGLDRDGCEAFLLDEPLGDLGALVVELVRATCA